MHRCRTGFIIDGFNVYHSILSALAEGEHRSLKWLNLRSLCTQYLSAVHPTAVIEGIYYFSAIATHIGPDTAKRHAIYCASLSHSGVTVELSRFRRKDIRCAHCHRGFSRYEEKETDVAMATKLFHLLIRESCDAVVLVSGDTDLLPAIREARRLYSDKKILLGFPYGRFSKELKSAASASFRIGADAYAAHQFPECILLGDGRELRRPPSW